MWSTVCQVLSSYCETCHQNQTVCVLMAVCLYNFQFICFLDIHMTLDNIFVWYDNVIIVYIMHVFMKLDLAYIH